MSNKDKGSEDKTQKATNGRFSLENLKKNKFTCVRGRKKNQQLFCVSITNTKRVKLQQESTT